jgi:tetratricopeptide (TPR) repeat protein
MPTTTVATATGDLRQYEKAIEDYSQSIRLEPDAAYTFNNRGFTYAYMGQYEKAIEDYDRALDLTPNWRMFTTIKPVPALTWGKWKKR